MAEKELNVNRKIRAREVRVIGPDGGQLGIMAIQDALRAAQEQELDLVEVAPTSKPPVCRIMDYGKYKYQQSKRAQEARKGSAAIQVKEVKFRPMTDDHDFQVKVRHIREFLGESNKVKVTVMFRGREIVYPERGQEVAAKVAKVVEDVAVIEQHPKLEGRNLTMVMAPKR
ncbi:MAG: translation initiation factor IF-3 [Deltaproteobacteria bacterium]|nr:translation initiation factor IF-3 [Deltaproteobacteria bacterium]